MGQPRDIRDEAGQRYARLTRVDKADIAAEDSGRLAGG